jgi:hypothetical protein
MERGNVKQFNVAEVIRWRLDILIKKQTPWPLVHKRNILTELPPHAGETLVPTFADTRVSRGQAADPSRPLISVF